MKRKTVSKTDINRVDIKLVYCDKYYNIFMNKTNCIDGLEQKEKEFIFRRFWTDGTVCAFHPEGIEDTVFFAPYATTAYDIYDYPKMALPVNLRAAKGFPSIAQPIDEKIVVGWALKSKKSLKQIAEIYINKIVNVEMIIQTNIKTHKLPWVIAASLEDEDTLKDIMEQIDSDEPEIYASAENIDKLKSLANSSPYIIDRLYDYKCKLEKELDTFFGVDNSVSDESRMLVDQVNANNEIINNSKEAFKDCIMEFFNKCNEVLNTNITWKKEEAKVKSVHEGDDNNDM